ncbi:MAG: RDD family protein [bacterium]
MESNGTVTCPVCGRPNRNTEQCTFCGANLKEAGPAPQRGAGIGSPPPREPFPRGAGGYPPSLPAPQPPPWSHEPGAAPVGFAGFWIRVVAYVIDSAILFLVMALLFAVGVFGYTKGSATHPFEHFSSWRFEGPWNAFNLFAFILMMAYFTYFLGKTGQTPGKKICGLRVIRTDGGNVSYAQAALRTLGYYINQLTLFIGFLWVAVDPRKQGLHDKIAGTLEIRLPPSDLMGWQQPQQPPGGPGIAGG